MKKHGKRPKIEDDDPIVGINVTPLVDVCLVLVIIFMVTAPILSDPIFKVILPKSQTQEGEEGEKIMVSISADGRIAIESLEVKNSDEFTRELKNRLAQSEDSYVIFKADENSTHGLLVELMYRAKEAGATALTIASEKKRE